MSRPATTDPAATDPAAALAALVDRHGLVPHPEGGLFAEAVRSGTVTRSDGQRRAALTVIHYVLPTGAVSRWHRLTGTDEVWTHVGGDPLTLFVVEGDVVTAHRLSDAGALLALVPAGAWQAARPDGGAHGYAHVTCTVAPGFDVADWHLAADAPDAPWAVLEAAAPGLR